MISSPTKVFSGNSRQGKQDNEERSCTVSWAAVFWEGSLGFLTLNQGQTFFVEVMWALNQNHGPHTVQKIVKSVSFLILL